MTQAGENCPRCQTPRIASLFCKNCNLFLESQSTEAAALPAAAVERVTFTRRFFGDILLEGLLVIITLIIGWFIWLYFTAKTSQTPAKRLLNVYIVAMEQYPDMKVYAPATAGKVWLREAGLKIVALGILDAFVSGIPTLVDYGWALFNPDRKAIHDEIAKTVVVYAPSGLVAQAATVTSPYPKAL